MKKEVKNKIKKLYEQYKDVIPYLFFGVCTTAVNIVSYAFFAHVLNAGTTASTILAWFFAVLFAYLTNRKWVFKSEAKTSKEIIREVSEFFGFRFATGVLDWLIMVVFVDGFHLNDVIIKAIANIIVIVLNYIASKLVIFAKKSKKK